MAPVIIPVKKIRIARRELIRFRSYLSMTLYVVAITYAKQAAMFGPRLVEHSIVIRVGRTVGDTMLENVKVDPRAPVGDQSFLLGTTLYFLDREILFGGVFPVQEGGG